jgi:hypothetical protein
MVPSIISEIKSITPTVYAVTVMVQDNKEPFFHQKLQSSLHAQYIYRMWKHRQIFGIPPIQQITLSCTQDGLTETLETYVPH